MSQPAYQTRAARAGAVLALAATLVLAGCQRHSEEEVRALLGGWVELGDTIYFESQRDCTAAVFQVESGDIKSRVPLFDGAQAVVLSGKQEGPFALREDGKSADKMFIDLMNADRPTGVAIQAASVEAKPCMNDKARNSYFALLNTDPAIVIFSRADRAYAVLDPVRGVVMMTSGGY